MNERGTAMGVREQLLLRESVGVFLERKGLLASDRALIVRRAAQEVKELVEGEGPRRIIEPSFESFLNEKDAHLAEVSFLPWTAP